MCVCGAVGVRYSSVTRTWYVLIKEVLKGKKSLTCLSLSPVYLQTLRAAGKIYLTFFMLVVFPGCFCLLSLIVAMFAMVSAEQEEASVAEASQKEKEFSQIVEALKRREEEEVRSFHHLHRHNSSFTL